jgi:hypothetical protein
MMREKVVITALVINKVGQVKHFQIKLPKTAKRIIGIELGGRLITNTKDLIVPRPNDSHTAFKRNTLLGELKLQSCENANVFYAGHLQSDNNIGYGDFSENQFWKAKPFTHQTMTFEETVIVNAESTIVQGVYKDRIGEQYETDVNYLVNVYLWYEQ